MLLAIMVLVRLRIPPLKMPPPLLVAELPERVELETVRVAMLKMPPPLKLAVLPERVELVTEKVPL